jgi:hypothetical protein
MRSLIALKKPLLGSRRRSSGVQEFRSSGVQEFRSSGVQEFRSSGVQEFRVARIAKLQGEKASTACVRDPSSAIEWQAPELLNSSFH